VVLLGGLKTRDKILSRINIGVGSGTGGVESRTGSTGDVGTLGGDARAGTAGTMGTLGGDTGAGATGAVGGGTGTGGLTLRRRISATLAKALRMGGPKASGS
jgi:hypothetical protein